MPLERRTICKFCKREIISEKMGKVACLQCLPNQGKAVDFKSQQEKNEYYKDQARKRRDSFLPKDRICPRCEIPKLEPRSWVVQKGLAICRACNYELNLMKGRRMDSSEAFDKAFTPVFTTRYTINGQALREVRKLLKVSMRSFADLCGCGVSYVNELEVGDTNAIGEEMYLKFVAAFEKLKEIPDYDEEIEALKKKQKEAKTKYGKMMGVKDRHK